MLQVIWNGKIYKGRVQPNVSMRFLLERFCHAKNVDADTMFSMRFFFHGVMVDFDRTLLSLELVYDDEKIDLIDIETMKPEASWFV